MDQTKLTYIWRYHHPIERKYTYYSHPHEIFSRIDDYFLGTHNTLTVTDASDIKKIAISDHAPITLTLRGPTNQAGVRTWRFPSNLQKHPDFSKYLQSAWTEYQTINKMHIDNPILFWEAAKAVLRGNIIYTTAHRKATQIKFKSSN